MPMEAFLEKVEPYSSYRFLLGLALGGLTLWIVVSFLISIKHFYALLADLDRKAASRRLFDGARRSVRADVSLEGLPLPRARPGRALKLLLLTSLLRLLGPRTIKECWPEMLGIVLLGAACLAIYTYVFLHGGDPAAGELPKVL